MTYGAFTSEEFPAFERPGRSRAAMPQQALCALALLASTSVGLWALYGHPLTAPEKTAPAAPIMASTTIDMPALRSDLAPAEPIATNGVPMTGLRRDAALLRRTFTTDGRAILSARDTPPQATFKPLALLAPEPIAAVRTPISATVAAPIVIPPAVVALEESVPLPMPRPANLLAPKVAQGPRPVAPDVTPGVNPDPAPADHRSFFDRLFRPTSPVGTVLAYAMPDDGGLGRPDVLGHSLPYDRWTAVYVIATHTVYLPDGTMLEAHSGLGASHDNPSSVAERMRGVTPPNVYDLQLREAPFHGVRALRLNPVDGNAVYGRAGLLAHTYMLGPRGDSNGCVVFKNYPAFLNAYDSGAIRRLAVVARLD